MYYMKPVIAWWIVLIVSLAGVWLLDSFPQTNNTGASAPHASIIIATSTEAQKPVITTHNLKMSPPHSTSTAKKSSALSSKKTSVATPSNTTPKKTVPLHVVTENTPTLEQTQTALSKSAARLRAALVNIICTTSLGSTLRSISGSGVIISSRGVVLTNAHIGQYMLLKDYPNKGSTSCTVRMGSPAKNAYTAKLMFISTKWITKNPTTLLQYSPSGTGEYDIALLAITKSLTKTPLPSSFPFVPLAEKYPAVNNPIVIGSYAAQFLTTNEIKYYLYPTIAYGNIKKVFTFGTNTIDLVSLGGTAAAQEGSSGGGIIDTNGNLTGTITTSTTQGNTDTRDLHAITAKYIRRDYEKETGTSLQIALSEKPQTVIDSFAEKIPTISSVLVKALTEAPK